MSDSPHLKSHREFAQKTQGDIAAIMAEMSGLTITQSQVSRWEENPESIPPKLLRPMAQALGLTMDELFDPPLSSGEMRVDAGDPYSPLRRSVSILRACLEAAPPAVAGASIPDPGLVEELCARIERKPNVLLAGHFDAGKSRLCNALLGHDVLPTRYQPTTCAGTWLRHSDDRPAWAEVVEVYGPAFDPAHVRNKEHCNSVRVASGELPILGAYAAHPAGGRSPQRVTVVAYLDSPVLRACNLLDVPGSERDETDTRTAGAFLSYADALIYVSRATGFLDEQDIVHLRSHLRQLPQLESRGGQALDNLLIVASHAHPGIKDRELSDLCDEGADTLLRELGSTVLAERTKRSGVAVTREDLRARIRPFWFETKKHRDEVRDAVSDMLGTRLPPAWLRGADDEVEAFRKSTRGRCDASIERYRHILADTEAARQDLLKRRNAETGRRVERNTRRENLLTNIDDEWRAARDSFSDAYATLVNDDAVEAFIRERYANKKDAEKHAAGAVIDQLQNALASDATVRAKRLAEVVEDYLGQYELDADLLGHPAEAPEMGAEFDARGAFLGGMAGLGTIGALGAWAATLGNLGGYIIVAKVAGVLAALGIEVGGSAALVALVAALGGPGVVTIALGLIFAMGIGWLFGESWHRRLARKLVKSMEKGKVRSKFEASIDAYWQNTKVAFEQAAQAVEVEYERHLDDLERVITETAASPDDLTRQISALERIRDFFAALPWKAPADGGRIAHAS